MELFEHLFRSNVLFKDAGNPPVPDKPKLVLENVIDSIELWVIKRIVTSNHEGLYDLSRLLKKVENKGAASFKKISRDVVSLFL
ncbi:MAG: hypothetical protein HRT37_18555 [Alteromonadaceae bacterium]|nr:hypothetical protein [Alteromonadaceae bacterium]